MRALFFTVCRFMWSLFLCSWLLLHQFVTYPVTGVAVTLGGSFGRRSCLEVLLSPSASGHAGGLLGNDDMVNLRF